MRVTAGYFVAGLAIALAVSGCNPAPPLDPEDQGPDSWILTRANHPTGYGLLDCFASGCHRDGGAGYRADSDAHRLPELSCASPGCHGDNGSLDQALVTGRIFADVGGGEPEVGVVVIAEEAGNPDVKIESQPSDSDGQFSLLISATHSYDFVLRDRNGVLTRSVDFSMPSLTINRGYTGSLDCAQCHGRSTAPFLIPIR